jgi:hypothetical protein
LGLRHSRYRRERHAREGKRDKRHLKTKDAAQVVFFIGIMGNPLFISCHSFGNDVQGRNDPQFDGGVVARISVCVAFAG